MSISTTKKIGRNIRKYREKRELSQEFMATKLKISQASYSRIEQGDSRLGIARLLEIADLLDISILSLLSLSERQVLKINQIHSQTVTGDVTQMIDDTLRSELTDAKTAVADLTKQLGEVKKLLQQKKQ